MPVLPALQAMLDLVNASPPPPPAPTPAAARESAHASMAMLFEATELEGPPVRQQRDHRVAVDGGEIVVRVYVPDGDGPFPCHVYLHGGGFWLGTLEGSDNGCRWPLPAEDCFTALRWVVDHAADLGVDAGRISVGGASAGGNLAAVVALMARDRGGPPLALQVLEIPVTDLTMSQPSVVANGTGYLLTTAGMEQYVGYYLADRADAAHAYASPLLAEELSGLPPALVMTAEFDPLRDEGEAYARRLADAGVPVEQVRWEGQFHGSQAMAKVIPDEAAAYHAAVVAALREAFQIS